MTTEALGSLLPEFRAWMTRELWSKATRSGYEGDVRRGLAFLAARLDRPVLLQDLTLQALRDLCARDEASKGSVTRRRSGFVAFFGFLCDKDLIEKNIAQEIPLPRPVRLLPKVLTEAEAIAVVEAPTSRPRSLRRYGLLDVRDRAVLLLLYASGLREGELCGLDVRDVFFDEDRILIRVRKGKGDRDRTVPCKGKELAEALRAWLARRVEFEPADEALFCNSAYAGKPGRRLRDAQVYMLVRKWGARVGIKVYPHLLRHTFATHLLRAGGNPRQLQEMLGHESLETTAIYLGVDQAELFQLAGMHPLVRREAEAEQVAAREAAAGAAAREAAHAGVVPCEAPVLAIEASAAPKPLVRLGMALQEVVDATGLAAQALSRWLQRRRVAPERGPMALAA